jgi:hypothetical protein
MWVSGEELTLMDATTAPAPTGVEPERRARAAPVLAFVRERLTTTPGRLVLASILILIGAVVCGAVATSAERSRDRAAEAVRNQTEPLLAEAVTLYTALSDANATATTTFLTGGLEPPARRAHYLDDLRVASVALATLTRDVGTSARAGGAVVTITQQLPLYAGLVESARANNLQGFPVGAAYLRQASALLTGTVLPAADRLYATEAERLSDDYGSGTSTATFVAFAIAVAVALGLLLLAQLYLRRLSHRVFNVPMAAATYLLLALAVWGLLGMIGEQNALARARRDGSDPVAALSATRVLFSRAQSDESLTLVNRGSDETDPADFARVMRVLAPTRGSGGLLAEVAALDRRTGTSGAARALDAEFASYRTETDRISGLQSSGQTPQAIALAVASAASSSSPNDRVVANLSDQINAAQRRFERAAADATSSLASLTVSIPLLMVLAAALALLGLRQRLGEYR